MVRTLWNGRFYNGDRPRRQSDEENPSYHRDLGSWYHGEMADKLIRKLRKVGDSHALVIDAATMEQLGISSDTPLQLTVEDGSLVVSPVLSGAGPQNVKDALSMIRKQPGYPKMLANLAK